MLRSLVEIARTTSLSDDHVTELIDGMFQVRFLHPFPHLTDVSKHLSFINHASFITQIFHPSGCRPREEGLSHVQRLQIDDEGIQGRLCRDWPRL